MQAKHVETPVALFVFNRPGTTQRVFQAIADVRPSRLLLIADGPRPGKRGEAEACQSVRKIISGVDWLCDVSTNFADQNLGCQQRMISGLNWVFSLVDEAILLEDDCLPDASFFFFCQEMLTRYRDDPRIAMVSGFNAVQEHIRISHSYYFSRFTHCWGWATWKRAWSRFDEKLTNWPAVHQSGLLQEAFERPEQVSHWTAIFDQTYRGASLDAWDFQWFYAMITNHSLSVVSRLNLVENIGFGPGATHTVYEWQKPKAKMNSITFPLVHPPVMIALRSADRIDQRLSGFESQSLASRIKGKIRRIMSKGGHYLKSRRLTP